MTAIEHYLQPATTTTKQISICQYYSKPWLYVNIGNGTIRTTYKTYTCIYLRCVRQLVVSKGKRKQRIVVRNDI